MGIFERLFKKKTPPLPEKPERIDKTVQRPSPPRKRDNTQEDTRPIKLPKIEDMDDSPLLREVTHPRAEVQSRVISTIPERPSGRDVTMADEEIDDAIDSTFDALFGDGEGSDGDSIGEDFHTSESELARDREETRSLFGQIAVNYIRPVKQFMFELKRGSASMEWIPVCLPAIGSMMTAMSTMELREEAEVLEIFTQYLEELQRRDLRIIDGEYQRVALDLYTHLEEILPETFLLGEEGVQREGIIIFSLLKQVSEVGKVTLDKIFAAGLSTLDMLFMANTTDLSRTTGIPARLAERIVAKLQDYKMEMERRPVDEDLGNLTEMLENLVEELHRYHDYYEKLVSSGWNDPEFNEKKKTYRKARQDASLKINVLLAELGEVELVEQIEKLPFDRRIDQLREYLASAHDE